MSDASDLHVRSPKHVELLGRPKLGLTHAIGQALAMGPVVSVFFNGYLLVVFAGASAPLAVVIALAGALCIGWTIGLYARRYAGAGALYEYAANSIGKLVGVGVAAAYLVGGLQTIGLIVLFLSLSIQLFATTHFGFDPGWWGGAAVTALLAGALQYLGIRIAAGVQLGATIVAAVPIVIVGIAVLVTGGAEGHTAAAFTVGPNGWNGIFRALLFGLGLFAGVETVASLGEEANLPRRVIPRAILLTTTVVGIFYVFGLYSATIGFGASEVSQSWGEDPLALATLGDRYLGSPWSAILIAGVIVDLFVVLIAFGNAHARLTFALARDRFLPRVLGTVSRHETPAGGIVLVLIAQGVVLLVASVVDDAAGMLQLFGIASGLLVSPVLFVLFLNAMKFSRREQRRAITGAVVLVAASMPVLAIYGTLNPFPTGFARIGVWIATAQFVAIVAWLTFLNLKRKDALSTAATYAPMVAQRRES